MALSLGVLLGPGKTCEAMQPRDNVFTRSSICTNIPTEIHIQRTTADRLIMNNTNNALLEVFPAEFLDGLEDKFDAFSNGEAVIPQMTFECVRYMAEHKPDVLESGVYDESKINSFLTNYFLED